jgi:hypothetical protein
VGHVAYGNIWRSGVTGDAVGHLCPSGGVLKEKGEAKPIGQVLQFRLGDGTLKASLSAKSSG